MSKDLSLADYVFTDTRIEYAKKKEKKAQIQFIKDETVLRDDVYKSHTVHVPSGEPPNSTSRPRAKRKQGVVRPITQGKLLRAGGPSNVSRSCIKRFYDNIRLQKPRNVSKPQPTAQPLPGKPLSNAKSAPTPPPPPAKTPVPPPPEEPDVELYRAKFAFQGQEGELTFQKDDVVELVEKDDNGWWLVKKDGEEGWAPNNYLELVPKKLPAPPAAPLPPARRPPPSAPTTSSSSVAPKAPVTVKPVRADASAKPIAVFPGLTPSNGSATPWKKPPGSANGSGEPTPASSRPSSSLGAKPPPPVATKPKVAPPPVAAKPGAVKPPGKPPIPTAARPPVGNATAQRVNAAKPAPPTGQMDLAAAVSILQLAVANDGH